ncbi:MAG: hypothetical protein ACRCXT_00995 [Paraclostridium sp.]
MFNCISVLELRELAVSLEEYLLNTTITNIYIGDYFLKFKYTPINIYYCTKNIWSKKFKEIKINIRNNC